MKDYFEGRSIEEWRTERAPWRRLAFRILVFLAFVVAIGMLLAGLSGCASEIRTEICQIHALGMTESGDAVVLSACASPETYKAAQR